MTEVSYRPLSTEEIEAYIQSGESMDKAGGYGIQGLGGALVDQIRGSYLGVVGLPLKEVFQAIEKVQEAR